MIYFAFLSYFVASSLLFNQEEKSFVSWMRSSNQFYSGDEYHFRLGIWLTNQRLVQSHNSDAASTFKLSMNHLSAFTQSEYKAILGFKPYSRHSNRPAIHKRMTSASESLDWRDKNAVNAVQNQGACGSCWAFSAIQNCEGAEFIKYNVLYKLSEQSLVDCSTDDGGCNGGLPISAFFFIIDHCDGKVMKADDYPYTATDDKCKFDVNKAIGHFADIVYIDEGDEEDLAAKCETYGTLSIGIDAGQSSFQLYTSGIYDDKKCSSLFLNHGVGLVGFGFDGAKKYWIVRNSWGQAWGERGYIKMLRGKNLCGLATSATTIVSK